PGPSGRQPSVVCSGGPHDVRAELTPISSGADGRRRRSTRALTGGPHHHERLKGNPDMQASSSNPGVWSVLGRSASSASAGRLLAVPALCLSSLCLAACGADLEGVEAPEGLDEDVFLADDAADGEDGAGATEALPAGSEGSELGSVSQALASGCTL